VVLFTGICKLLFVLHYYAAAVYMRILDVYNELLSMHLRSVLSLWLILALTVQRNHFSQHTSHILIS